MVAEMKFRLPKEIPLEVYPKPDVFLNEAHRLIEAAEKQGLILRVMGPLAIHFYFPNYVELYHKLERLGDREFTDIDFASYGKYRGKLVPFFQANGYEIEKRAMMIMGQDRHIYFSDHYTDHVPMVDVFYDKLAYNHPIDYRGRLEIHPHCVSMTDLLLQKLQIVQINEKDLKDATLLLLASGIGEDDRGIINARYIAKLMSNDWGFYYTSTMNLGKVKTILPSIQALNDEQRGTICDKIDRLLAQIEQAPKSFGWKQRAKTGTRKPWYNEVSDWV